MCVGCMCVFEAMDTTSIDQLAVGIIPKMILCTHLPFH